MFSMLPAHAYPQSQHFKPQFSSPLSSSPVQASSPLSPRNANLPSNTHVKYQRDKIMSSPTPSCKQYLSSTPAKSMLVSPPRTRSAESKSSFSKRATKPNPLMGRREGCNGRETRRKLFLKRVREGAEEKRWASRGGDDEIMRTLWVAEERRREERRRREALRLSGDMGEDDEILSIDEIMADELAMKEEQELEALLMSMSQEERVRGTRAGYEAEAPLKFEEEMDPLLWDMGDQARTTPAPQDQPQQMDTPYGSDDEYDHIFMDVIQNENAIAIQSQSQQSGFSDQGQEMMDMS